MGKLKVLGEQQRKDKGFGVGHGDLEIQAGHQERDAWWAGGNE